MPRELRALIDATVEASELSQTEKDELRRELESHILSHIYELELEGRTEAEIISSIKSSFGDTEEIGKALFFAHRKLENIPWFGSFFYYKPLWYGFWIFLVHFVTWIIYAMLKSYYRLAWRAGSDPNSLFIRLLSEMQQFVMPTLRLVVITAVVGLLVRVYVRRKLQWHTYIEAVLLSVMPFVCALIVIAMVSMQRDGIGLFRFLEWTDMYLSVGLLFGLVIGAKNYSVFKLIKKNVV